MSSKTPPSILVQRVDYTLARDRQALLEVLGSYAIDPVGGGEPLAQDTRNRLCDDLAKHPLAASFLAWAGDEAVGLINTFEGYSTFKARPLLNIHDVAVLPAWRGQGVGQALLAACEQYARERGCCKITLEVLTGNHRAMRSYTHFGFEPFVFDPADGQATLMQKWL